MNNGQSSAQQRNHGRLFLLIFLFILAPLGTIVVISTMMLLGIELRVVFAPGREIQSLLNHAGIVTANRVAVASTAFLWWALLASLGLAWEWRRNPRRPNSR